MGMVGQLKRGDAVFIPRAWWHHLRSLDTSISLNCFFGPEVPLSYFLHVARSCGVTHCTAIARDFVLLGMLGREFDSRLISDVPTGRFLCQMVKDGIGRRLPLRRA